MACRTCGYPGHEVSVCWRGVRERVSVEVVALSAPVAREFSEIRGRTTPPLPKEWHTARWEVRRVKLYQGWRPRGNTVPMTSDEIAEFGLKPS